MRNRSVILSTMTLTVELTPEEKARIEAETGMSAAEWARKWIQVGLSQLHQSRAAGEVPDALAPEERERLLDELAEANVDLSELPATAFSRSSIYADHD